MEFLSPAKAFQSIQAPDKELGDYGYQSRFKQLKVIQPSPASQPKLIKTSSSEWFSISKREHQ